MTRRLIAICFLLAGAACAQVQTETSTNPAKHSWGADARRWDPLAVVSVDMLRAPSRAVRDFEKASHCIAKQDWRRAAENLEKGLAIYPNDATAYNNLGVVYDRLGQPGEASQALQQAILLNRGLAPAYVNLGRIRFREKDYREAESLLTKANSLASPPDADELFLLAYAQLSNHHQEEAIQTARQGHDADFVHHASLHLVAASAYEQQGKIAESIAELKVLLNEEPAGPEMEHVRTLLARYQSQVSAR